MLRKDSSAPRIDLAKTDRLDDAGPRGREGESTHAREKIEVPNHAASPRRSACTFVMRSELALVLHAADPQVF